MGNIFEDYVSANLGIRKPFILDVGLPSASPKAAGIIGTQYIDSDTYFLYEKTGENNQTDWVKIGEIGQPRGQLPKGIDGSVQFNSGESFGGTLNLTYDYDKGLLSGESGHFNSLHSDFITGQTGHFGEELSVGDPSQEDVFVVEDGNISLAGSANFSGPINGPSIQADTGKFNTLFVSGDAHVSGDFYVSGTTYVQEIIDTTVSGSISGYTGIFNTTSGRVASFTESLTISGISVATGVGGTIGGFPVIGGDQDNIDFGGTEPGDVRNINFQQGGENVMVINEDGDVNIQNDLTVTGNISGGIISGKTGVFTESLTISGFSVLTGFEIPGGGSVIGGDQDNIDFGGTDPGDVRNINFQQGGENVMVINEDGDVNIQNDLTVTGNISGGIISGKTGVFTESLTISGFSVLTGFEIPGGGSVIGGDQDNIDFGGTDPGDVRNINFQQGGENVMVINEDGDVNIQNDLTVTGNISGSTGQFNEVIINGVNIEDSITEISGNLDSLSGQSIASFSALSDDLNSTGQFLLNSQKNYPVVTGGGFDCSTYMFSLFRDLGAENIEIDLSCLAGGGATYQSTLLWEENNGDLVLLDDETTTSYPATQLFENSGDNAYMVREDVFGSNTEAAQYFEETGVDITLTTSSYLPPIPPAPAAVSTQWFQEDGSDQLSMRETSLATSNPAVQLWEPTGIDQYTPRPEPFSSTTESAQYFQETGIDQLTTT